MPLAGLMSDCTSNKTNAKIAVIAAFVCVVVLSVSSLHVLTTLGDDTNFTLRESSDGNLYYVNVTGDYAFDKYMATGSTSTDELFDFLSENVTCGKRLAGFVPQGCSVFTVKDSFDGGYLAGRNFDYYQTIVGVVYTHGKNIYNSVSTVDLAMFSGVNATYYSMMHDTALNAAAYLPLDGINEKGVFVAINSVSGGPALVEEDPAKTTLFITSSLRAVLDHCDSTASAVELLKSYNLHSNSNYHVFISDRGGNSVTVEVCDGKTYVTETDVLTNHYLTKEGSAPDVPVKESSTERFDIMTQKLKEQPTMTVEEVKNVLISVKQNDDDLVHYTRWSVVYDFDTLDISLYLRIGTEMDYDHPYTYNVSGWGIA